jgi:CheY-like chemotaxis protein
MTPHLVVLDLHLPGISGVEVLRQINADQRFAGMRVVITTADVQLAETLRDAADLILLKPVSYRQLADLASRFLQMLE